MLFGIILIVILVGIGLIIYGNMNWWDSGEGIWVVGTIITIAAGVVAIAMLCCIIGENVGVDAKIESHKARYEALVYKIESDAYRDEFGVVNKSVIDEIQDWNEDLAYNKEIQDDFWLGIFYPNIYDDFETIDYEKFMSKRKKE